MRRISGIEKANEKVLEGKAVISLPMQEHTDKELGIAFRGAFVISCQCLQLACLMASPEERWPVVPHSGTRPSPPSPLFFQPLSSSRLVSVHPHPHLIFLGRKDERVDKEELC